MKPVQKIFWHSIISMGIALICTLQTRADNGIWAGANVPRQTATTKRLEEGLMLCSKQRWDQACKLFDAVSDFSILSYGAQQIVCQAYVAAGEFSKGEQLANALLSREQTDKTLTAVQKGQTRRQLADALTGQKKYDAAIQDYQLAAQLRPDIAYSSLYQAGNLLAKTNRPKEAVPILQKALAAGPNQNGLANKCLGDCYLKLGKPKEAIEAYKASIAVIEKLRKAKPDRETTPFIGDYKGLIKAYHQLNMPGEEKAAQAKLDAMVSGWHEDLFGAAPPIK